MLKKSNSITLCGLFALQLLASNSGSISLAKQQASGKATIYSNKFAGKKTANGEKYNPHAMTAASRTLPIGSKVEVKNKQTGKSEVVKINDKTAKGVGSVVDLSKGAADKIGVKGTAPVDAKVVSSPK